MKVVIFAPYASVVPHFETELEIAQQHLDEGDTVTFVDCLSELDNCDFNPEHDLARCLDCQGRRRMGHELVHPRPAQTSFGRLERQRNRATLGQPWAIHSLPTQFTSVEELINYRIDNFDIGYAVLSSLVSQCRDPQPDLTVHQPLLNRFMQSAYRVYRTCRIYLTENQPDLVYVFNGRFAAMRAVLRAAQAAGVDCRIHERGCDGEHYSLYENHLPHDLVAIEAIIRSHWAAAEKNATANHPIDRTALARQWFQDRVNRVEQSWYSFVADQQRGQLPANWNPQRHNIVIFNSSDDEFVAIGDSWRHSLYPDQLTGLGRLAEDLSTTNPEAHLTVRVHPNLKGIDNPSTRELLCFSRPNVTVIPPDSSIDSYQLCDAADWVVTFGSTMGVEATMRGKPSLLLGPTFYQNLDCTYRATEHQQAIDWLSQSLPAKPELGGLMYGYWRQTFGVRHRHFHATSLFEGTFKGEVLYAKPPRKTIWRRIKNELKKVSFFKG